MPTKTKIDWCDYSINPVKGLCPVDCKDNQGKPYCYARRLYKRFKWNPEIRFEDVFWHGLPGQIGDKYFVGSTIELFGDWIEKWWLENTFEWVRSFPQRTFIFLTKRPENLAKWDFPSNCWVGLSVDGTPNAPLHRIYNGFDKVMATVKFISFEPLLAQTKLDPRDVIWTGINWVIIGAQSPYSEKTAPKWEWVKEIIDAADTASVPVFLKENLRLPKYSCEGSAPFYKRTFTHDTWELRQEFPTPSLKVV